MAAEEALRAALEHLHSKQDVIDLRDALSRLIAMLPPIEPYYESLPLLPLLPPVRPPPTRGPAFRPRPE